MAPQPKGSPSAAAKKKVVKSGKGAAAAAKPKAKAGRPKGSANDKAKGKPKGKDKAKDKEKAAPPKVWKAKVGSRVLGKWKDKTRWFPGVVVFINPENGYCDIDYDDGDKEKGVKPIRVRSINYKPTPRERSPDKAKDKDKKKKKADDDRDRGERHSLRPPKPIPARVASLPLTSDNLEAHEAAAGGGGGGGGRGKPRKPLKPGEREMDRLYRTDWSGNSDSKGSVDSACLDENVCFECGESTANATPEETANLLLCDRCDGELHLHCTKLTCLPRSSVEFVCPRCLEDERQFKGLTYDIVVRNWKGEKQSVEFKIKKSRKAVGFSFSPSRPIALAWSEFEEKQFMCVSRVFDYDTLRKLTHGTVEAKTLTGRTSHVWNGVLEEISACLKSGVMSNLIHRDGRYDMRLPDFLVEKLGLADKLQPILERLRTVMGTPTPEIRTHNVVFVPVGSAHQRWHADDTLNQLKKPRYFTIIIHLNLTDENCGGTEVWSRKLKRGDLIRGRPGDAFVFSGSMLHRGQGNSGQGHRLFYYASFACRQDANAEYVD